ncbi:trypsin-1-like [Uranotaenia lowii]|uniref:trypsin-1-like n=1 Tax=Uranotaenia lowii TaxID=190385 RepID=UPI002479C4C4|nr:trypsin-1-like [Uranotaenia lowii]
MFCSDRPKDPVPSYLSGEAREKFVRYPCGGAEEVLFRVGYLIGSSDWHSIDRMLRDRMRTVFVVSSCCVVLCLLAERSNSALNESESVQSVVQRLEHLNWIYANKRNHQKDSTNKINYELYVTPVMSETERQRARNPLLSWLANVLNFAGVGQTSEVQEDSPVTKPDYCSACTCGVSPITSRIVGGVKADIKEFPWMVQLLYRGTYYCGGTLISDRYILTAAHCVLNFKAAQITVKLYDVQHSKMVIRAVEKLHGNNGFSLDTFNNDIALVKLHNAVNVVERFVTVCLPTPGKSYANKEGTVTGWGKLANGSLSQVLQKVQVPIMTNAQCKKSAYRASRITDNMMCAGFPDGGHDACQGDSGGPLQIGDTSLREVVGIVSWGEGCAKPNYPGVYTRVNRYLQWIKNNSRDGCLCDPPE